MQEDRQRQRMLYMNIPRLVITLGIPTIISTLITNIYNMVDTYFVGTLGTAEQGAIGIVFTLQFILQAIAFTLGHGSGTYAAKYLAEKNNQDASKYVSTAFFLSLLLGTLIAIIGLSFINPILYLLGSTDTILPFAREYCICTLVSGPLYIASMVLNNNLRYEGRAIYAMVGLVSGALLNILGDFLLVSVLHLGVLGAGLSTAISQTISFIILLIMYFTKATGKIKIKYFSRKILDYFLIIRAGFPSFLRNALMAISSGVLNQYARMVGEIMDSANGVDVVISQADMNIAAMSIASRYTSLISCIGMGLGQGFQPVSAFNYSVGLYSRVKKALLFTIGFGMALVFTFSLPGIINPYMIAWLFNKNENVISLAGIAIRYASIFLVLSPITIVTNMLYQSIRQSEIASFLSMLRSGLILIPTIILIYSMGYGFNGIAISTPIADAISAVICIPFALHFVLKVKNEEENTK